MTAATSPTPAARECAILDIDTMIPLYPPARRPVIRGGIWPAT